MKKLLLAAGVATALFGLQSAVADTLRINNGTETFDVNISSFTYNSTQNMLSISTTANLVLDGGDTGGGDTGGGDTGGGDTGGGDTGGGDTGGGDTGGGDDGNCGVDGVICKYDVASWPHEANQGITIPKGQTVSSKFTTGKSSDRLYGGLYFEASAGSGYPATNVWISRTPGGSPISSDCIRENVSYIFNLKWSEFSASRRCVMAPGTEYYINMKHTKASSNQSTVYRYIK